MFMFACFYVSLQPLIVIPVILYIFVMIYARKIYRLTYCKKSLDGTNLIGKTMFNIIVILGPIMFVVGMIFFSSYSTHFKMWNIPNLITILLVIMIVIVPECYISNTDSWDVYL